MEPLSGNIFLERIDDFDGKLVCGVDPMLRDRQGLRAKVLSAGPDSELTPGDVVIIGRATGTEVNFAGTPALVCRERDILAVCGYAH